MKQSIFVLAALLCLTISSCSSDDNTISGEGHITLEFDNAYNDNDLILSTTSYNACGAEQITINKLKYIISNIRLENENGEEFTYPKNDSYFIVSEENQSSQFIDLSQVPAGNYTKITFGIGVDQEKYLEGAEGQGDFLELATNEGMIWSWTAGYKFLVYEGMYTSESVTAETAFSVHMGSHGTALDNYSELTLDLPMDAVVRTNVAPAIHIVANISDILNGTNQIFLEQGDQIHVDGEKAPLIVANVDEMFTVDHIHN
ncbi:MbnP family protein [Mangrovimonas aestuarii]|uniref:MbnP family protein n=1 Tax=Mangrovimonas aestuarii TaxID=3018443 RepID=UPI002378D0A5|nr:MbnP family protein [Mangrovimonas aestuarii]